LARGTADAGHLGSAQIINLAASLVGNDLLP
jgi:hypothetical protein